MAKKTLDLRGLSCPQPVFETKRAVEDPAFDGAEVIVDTKASVENIQRLLSGFKGISYTVEEGEDFTVNISKG
jgi:tRNA 2-thiouridine synthesizing protein A